MASLSLSRRLSFLTDLSNDRFEMLPTGMINLPILKNFKILRHFLAKPALV